MAAAAKLVDPAAQPTWSFAWGEVRPLMTAADSDEGTLSTVHVTMAPGRGHERHNHPESDELIHVLSGEGEQMVADGEPFPLRAGQTVVIPKGVWHSTVNTGTEPMAVLAVYAPAGPERVLAELADQEREEAPDVD